VRREAKLIVAVIAAYLAASSVTRGDAEGAKLQDDVERGQALHDAHCLGCHGHGAYLLERRHAKTLQQLEAEVKRWNGSVYPPLTREELTLVTRFLDLTYYRFPGGK
jgi:mono/diheme cytochrome c family protein